MMGSLELASRQRASLPSELTYRDTSCSRLEQRTASSSSSNPVDSAFLMPDHRSPRFHRKHSLTAWHAANERTFLGYLRTSVALSMLGAVVAQLYRLHHSPHPDPVFGFFVLSKPICGILQCSALGMVLLGAIRYFRQQSAMASGKVFAGGWEVLTIVIFSSSVCCRQLGS